MLQAAGCDGLTLDTLTIGQYLFGAAEGDIRRREVVDALMITVIIVMFDEDAELTFDFPR
jgi:predicted nucleic acid-binding protein